MLWQIITTVLPFSAIYSWYDGKVYVEDGKVSNGGKISQKKLEQMSILVNDTIKKNDLTLKYDYFRK